MNQHWYYKNLVQIFGYFAAKSCCQKRETLIELSKLYDCSQQNSPDNINNQTPHLWIVFGLGSLNYFSSIKMFNFLAE